MGPREHPVHRGRPTEDRPTPRMRGSRRRWCRSSATSGPPARPARGAAGREGRAQPWREELQHWRDEQQRREEQLTRGEEHGPRSPRSAVGTAHRPAGRERRAGLPPEPPRGIVPSASAGSLARPMRIEPDGRQFDAEATVGIERPTQFPAAFQQQPQPRNEPQAEPPSTARGRTGRRGTAEEAPQAQADPDRRARAAAARRRRGRRRDAEGGHRLGLPWAPNAPKGDSPDPAAATRALQGPNTSGTAPTANGVKSALASPAGNSALGQLTGSVVDPVTGTSCGTTTRRRR